MSHFALSSSLQAFFNQRGVDVERPTADAMIKLMVDWFRLVPIQGMAADMCAAVSLWRLVGGLCDGVQIWVAAARYRFGRDPD